MRFEKNYLFEFLEEIMLNKKRQYIRLMDGKSTRSVSGNIEVVPQSRVIQLGSDQWGWIWNRPSGLLIRQGNEEKHIRLFNFTRFITVLLYGLSFSLILMGGFKAWERKSGRKT